METYIEQGRFGEFVTNILEMEMERKKETAQKDEDYKLWLAYIHSMTDQSFHDWKKGLMEKKEPVSYAMTDKQVDIVKQQFCHRHTQPRRRAHADPFQSGYTDQYWPGGFYRQR